jgi:hypothetical protein
MHDTEAERDARNALLQATASWLISHWVWKGHIGGRELVEERLDGFEGYVELAARVFGQLRNPVTHGDEPPTDAIRERTILVWTDLTRAGLDALNELSEQARERALDQGEGERLRGVAKLLDSSVTEALLRVRRLRRGSG